MVCFSLAGCFIRVKLTKGIGIQNWSSVPGFDGLCVAEVENCFLIEHGSVPEHFFYLLGVVKSSIPYIAGCRVTNVQSHKPLQGSG